MVGFDKELAHKVWRYLEDNATSDTIASILPLENRTIERLRVVMKEFKEGKHNTEIETKEWKEDTVASLREWWKDYCRSKLTVSRDKHVQNLLKLAKRLRDRIINPELRRRSYEGKSVWYWGGQDWRLAPTIWFSLVTPFLEAGDFWGLNFSDLMLHLSDSPFLKHYHELENKAIELQRELNQAAEQLGKANPSLYYDWVHIQDELRDYATSSFVPDIIPSPDNVAKLPYEPDYCNNMIERFAELIPGLDNRFRDMEQKLQQLWDDLDPDNICSIIELGKCEQC